MDDELKLVDGEWGLGVGGWKIPSVPPDVTSGGEMKGGFFYKYV